MAEPYRFAVQDLEPSDPYPDILAAAVRRRGRRLVFNKETWKLRALYGVAAWNAAWIVFGALSYYFNSK